MSNLLTAGFRPLAAFRSLVLPERAESETSWDVPLAALGQGVALAFDRHLNRTLARGTHTYERTADCSSLVLPAYPVETVTSVLVESDGESTDIVADIVNTWESSGIVEFGYTIGSYLEKLTVSFTGGYWLDDGESMPAGATALPSDLLQAWIEQCKATIAASSLFGAGLLEDPSTSGVQAALADLQLTPAVRAVLLPYKRFA